MIASFPSLPVSARSPTGRRILAALALVMVTGGAPAEPPPAPGASPAPPAALPGDPDDMLPKESPYTPSRTSNKAARIYGQGWGVDQLTVRLTESGELIRFSYRVIDPKAAAPLNDKRLKPVLIDQTAGVSLVVPEMENIGMLRQTAAPQAGRVYWLVFSNKGVLVKRGHRVDVVIGPFHAANLVVD